MIMVEGKQVINLLPENTRQAALVDMKTLGRLAALLPQVSLFEVKRAIIDKISDSNTMEEFIEVLNTELAFHTTVNLIREVTIEDLISEKESILGN